jgi:hypothetical protein
MTWAFAAVFAASPGGPAGADEIVHTKSGYRYVRPAGAVDGRDDISCEVIGLSYLTKSDPRWGAAYNGLLFGKFPKPTHGWCTKVASFTDAEPVRIKITPSWPLNLGPIARQPGLRCTIDQDGYGFTCDWPPFTQAIRPFSLSADAQEKVGQWRQAYERCRTSMDSGACFQSRMYASELTSMGLCYGRIGEDPNERGWHPCE